MSNKKTTPPLRGTPPKEGNHSPSPKGWQAKPDGVVPRLRFPEFQDAGEWVVKKLDEIADLYKGNGISKADIDVQGKVPCIRYGELYTIYSEVIETVFSKTSNPPSDLFFSRKNDVIIPASGETKIDIAKASCVMADNVALGGDLNIIRSSHNGVFISYYLNGPKKLAIARIAQGDTVVHLYLSQLQLLEIGLPTADEQQKIADCLSSIDELITAQTQKLNTLKTHKKGLMQHLFPAEGETLPKLRFPEFQDAPEWEENLLGSRVMKVGSGITPRGGDKNYKNNGRPFVRSQNVGWGELLLDDVAYIDEQTHATFPATEIENGDVLLNITGASIGRCAVADFRIKRGNVNQHVCIIRLKAEELTPEFLNQYLLSQYGQKQIDSFQAGGNRQGLNFAQVRSFVIPHPSQEEQIKVAQFLSSIDDLITAQTQKLATLKTHKKALMQQLFPAMEEVSS